MVSLDAVMLRCATSVLGLCTVLWFDGHLAAQCQPLWQSTGGIPGVHGMVDAMVAWDPDGPGPAAEVMVLGGDFTAAGPHVTNDLAAYDPATLAWLSFGTGSNSRVSAVAALPNGDLIVGGDFTAMDAVPVSSVARWDGTSWQALGTGTSGHVHALVALSNGDLVAGGAFSAFGTAGANGIARWDGSSWTAFGSGTNGPVKAIVQLPNGDIVAGGSFSMAGGVAVTNVARWDGTTWHAVGGPAVSGAGVEALAVAANGDILAGGDFPGRLRRWVGTHWQPLEPTPTSGFNGLVRAVAVLPNGDVVAGGEFTSMNFQTTTNRLARWNGVAWVQVGAGVGGVSGQSTGHVHALAVMPNGELFVGGWFDLSQGVLLSSVASWTGGALMPLGNAGGTDHYVYGFAAGELGDTVAVGRFSQIEGLQANCVARWDGSAWATMGSGISGGSVWPFPFVETAARLANGDVVVGGNFSSAGGVPVGNIARWDGASWHAMGQLNGRPYAMTTLPNGDLIIGGTVQSVGGVAAAHIARWDGVAWSALGSGLNGVVRDLAVLANGDLLAVGDFTVAGGVAANRIARWDGSAWSSLGVSGWGYPNPAVMGLAVLPNGDVVVCGTIAAVGAVAANNVARWDGSSWHAMGAGISSGVNFVATMPDGSVVAPGPNNDLVRWDGTSWSAFVSGADGGLWDARMSPTGELFVSGDFSSVGGMPAPFVARVVTSCPASVAASGAGCAGSAGLMDLTADSLPWLGGSFEYRCSGFAATSIGFGLFGNNPVNVSMPSVHPAGGIGCSLLASTEIVQVLAPAAGEVVGQAQLPASPVLVGVQLHNQVIQMEFVGLGIGWIGSSNAQILTTGSF